MKVIPLISKVTVAFATVDDEDFALVKNRRWFLLRRSVDNRLYAWCWQDKKAIYMHRLIMGIENKGRGIQVDHRHGRGLNNRRSNLRVCSYPQNAWNSKNRHNKTGFRGVRKNAKGGWQANIRVGKDKRIYLGAFPTPEAAASAYKKAAEKYHGEFAGGSV